MTEVRDISARLSELAAYAEREDWLYQAELQLAKEFSAVAKAFSLANPGTEIICENYIGQDSVVRHSARSSILRTIKTIEKSLNRLTEERLIFAKTMDFLFFDFWNLYIAWNDFIFNEVL